jgi:hypothetical protein
LTAHAAKQRRDIPAFHQKGFSNMAKINDPFAANYIPTQPTGGVPKPPKLTAGASSPLDRTRSNAPALQSFPGTKPWSGPPLQLAQEQRRAEQIPAEIAAGQRAPRFGDRPAGSTYPKTVPFPVNPNPGSKAGPK